MLEEFKLAVYWAREFNDEGLHIILMILALIYIAIKKEEKVHRRLLLGYSVLLLCVYFFPPATWLITRLLGENVYWRMLWLFPLPIVIAYTCVKIYARTKKIWAKACLLLGSIALLAVMGQVLYIENSPYEKRSNWEKIPSSPVAICDIINQNRGTEDEWAMVAAPEDMVPYIMVYDASIRQIYGRKGKSRSKYIEKIMDDEVINYAYLSKKLREHNCNYIVLPEGEGRIEGMSDYGFDVIGTVGTYIVYKDVQWTP